MARGENVGFIMKRSKRPSWGRPKGAKKVEAWHKKLRKRQAGNL